MRFRIDVAAGLEEMPWADVHGAARAVVYGLLKSQDERLAAQLHDEGWKGKPLRPVGVSPPLFQGAPRRRGIYTTSDRGSVWFGSPVPQIAAALLAGVAARERIRWGRVPLAVKGVQLESPPDHRGGETVFESATPVLIKHESRYLLPGHPAYLERFQHNVRHKADLLGLPNEVELEVLGAGSQRRFDVQGAARIGATVRVRIAAAPALLDALYVWGLGLGTNQGFGWIR